MEAGWPVVVDLVEPDRSENVTQMQARLWGVVLCGAPSSPACFAGALDGGSVEASGARGGCGGRVSEAATFPLSL